MTTYCAVLLTVLAVVAGAHIWRKERLMAAVGKLLESAERRDTQIWDLLEVVKARQESARIEHREASVAKSDATATAAELTATVERKAVELAQEIKAVPPQVMELIKEDQKNGDPPAARPPGSGAP